MNTTFMNSPSLLFTSESVTEGHPDKLCDQISDGVLDACLAQDPYSRVACETATTTGMIVVFGEITTTTYVDIPAVVRKTIEEIGYTHSSHGFDAKTCGVMVSIIGVPASAMPLSVTSNNELYHYFDLEGYQLTLYDLDLATSYVWFRM